jgi:hypothetical protein
MALVYTATHLASGRVYVGMTTRSLARRRSQHIREVLRGGRTHFHNALRVYGPGAFGWATVASELTRDAAVALEVHTIASRNTLSPRGFNLTTGGDGAFVRSASTCQKIRDKATGRVRSLESRLAQSRATLGVAKSQSHRTAISKGQHDRKHTAETKAKLSVAKTGRQMPASSLHKWRQRDLSPTKTLAALANLSAALRKLTPAQETNVFILRSLGAPRRDVATWFAISVPTVKRLSRPAVLVQRRRRWPHGDV